jgi:RimJ/RimL family protein N-acetyltransferase
MSIRLRAVTSDDAQQIFKWRNDAWIVSLSSSQRQVNWEEHIAWFHDVLASDRHLLLIIESKDGVGAGLVRLDRIDEYQARITIYLLKEFTGQGIGVYAIGKACAAGFSLWSIHTINAHIRCDNRHSISAFSKAGFLIVESSNICPAEHCEMILLRSQTDCQDEEIMRDSQNNYLKSQEHKERIQQHYLPLLQKHGSTFRAVDWGSSQGQNYRFKILLEVGDLLNASILDIGCGVGHLVNYLAEIGYQGNYVGIDTLPEMVAAALTSYPNWHFRTGDILGSESIWQADYVIGSGLFTFGDQKLMELTIEAMFKTCNHALAFNSLSSWATQKESGEFYADPLTTVKFCRTLTPWVVLRHDYMQHDFTIYMYRQPQI